MKNILCFILPFLILRCNTLQEEETPKEFLKFEFNLEGFDWDGDPYKFSSFITDSVLHSQGSQRAAWDFSYIGNIEYMHKAWDNQSSSTKELSQEQKDSFALFERKDALPYILEKSKDHPVVIINEGHHMPQHRVFTTQLLEGLKKQGFKHLGLEAYFNSPKTDSILQVNGYPTLTSGFYTKEPQFGNLIRVAHQMGFKIFGYESQGHEDGKSREINQAKNIQKYIEKYPNEKILIHCGFDHGYEGELSNKWEKAMAGRLTEFTDIDPLTINQVIYSERSNRGFENPYYQLTDVNTPSVFMNNHGDIFGKYRPGAWFDIAIFHPRSKKINRPNWMTYGNRKEVDISFEEADMKCPCLVFAYKKGEEIGVAVPYDIQEVKEKKVILVLDDSDFEIVIWNPIGEAVKTELKHKK